MKRIAMISYHTCPLASEEGKESGGMNVYVLELSKALARLGHEVDIFTRSTDANNQSVVEVADRLRVVHVVAGPQEPINKKEIAPYIDEFVTQYFKFCKREGIAHDLVHAHYYLSGLVAQKIKKTMPAIPMVITFHTLALMKNLVARNIGERETEERIVVETTLAGEAQQIIVPSEAERSYLHYLYNAPLTRITVIPPGVDRSVFHQMDRREAKKHIGVAPDQHLVLFVGRIEPLKGIDLLLYAMKIVVARNPDIPVCLCVVGGDTSQDPARWPENLRSLEELRKILQLSANVKFVGRQPQHELPYYYNAADMLVMPSHYESFGMTALEAMSCGVPVITTNVAGVSSLFDENHAALITSVNNPLLLASQMEFLLKSPDDRTRIGAEVQKTVADLDWSTVAEKIDRVYSVIPTDLPAGRQEWRDLYTLDKIVRLS